MTDSGGNIDVAELRDVVDQIAAKGGETPDQRLRRVMADVVKDLGEPVSKPVRALIRSKIVADDEVRDLRLALADSQAKYDHQQKTHQKLQELSRELSNQNKTIRAHYEEQFQAQRQQQEALRDSFRSSMVEIEERIQASNQEQEATRKNQEELQERIRAVLDMDARQREFHAQQMALKDQEVAILKEALLKAQAELKAEARRGQHAQVQIEEYAKKFEQVQASMKDNARAFQDLKKHVSNANHRNKAIVKENQRLNTELDARTLELAAVKAQFEKFLRRNQSDKNVAEPGTVSESS